MTSRDGRPSRAYRPSAVATRGRAADFAEHAIAAALRSELTPAEAADVLWLYTSADVYRLLVGTAGWAHERYTAWLADTLDRGLLGDPTR